jgi:hypothetical protein
MTLPISCFTAFILFACAQPKKPGDDDLSGKTQPAQMETTDFMANAFVPLFDGKTLAGWHTYNKKSAGSAWKVKEGALYLDVVSKAGWQTEGGGDLVTDQEFENFHLRLEWKISEGGNSGIIFLVHEDPSIEWSFETGPEMQVLDNERHADSKINKHRAGDLYDLIACSKETVKPAGEWNLAEVIVNRGQLELRLNGETVVKTSYGDEEWKELVAGSKFKKMPSFGTFTKGKVALQDHGNAVWYRNIEIARL